MNSLMKRVHKGCGEEVTGMQVAEDDWIDYCPMCEQVCEGEVAEIANGDEIEFEPEHIPEEER